MNRGLRIGSGVRLGGLGAFGIRGGGASDTTPPTVTITSTESSPSAAQPIPLTFTFSETVTGFAIGDITVGAGGSVGNFAGSGASYTADLTVTGAGATITVDVAQGVCVDGAGNGNTAATQFSITSSLYLRDDFTTNDDAPMTSPRTCEPGPGVLTVTDAGNRMSVTGATLTIAKAAGVPRIHDNTGIAKASGLTFKTKMKLVSATGAWTEFGFDSNNSGDLNGGQAFRFAGAAALSAYPNASGVYSVVLDTYSTFAIIQRSAGFFAVVDGILYGVYTTPTPATVYAALYDAASNGGVSTFDAMTVTKLGAPWNTDYGIATARVAVPTTGETLAHEANCIVEFTWTVATNEVLELDVRRTDADNRWVVRCDQAGSTIKLIERNATVETERSSAAQTWTNTTAYRIIVICRGNNIHTVVATTTKNAYTSASFNNTATSAQVAGFATGANFVTWPTTLSGAALSTLNAINP